MKNFKALITTDANEQIGLEQKKVIIKQFPFYMRIQIDKNNQICDVQPRTFMGEDLFSKYHGRMRDWSFDLVQDMKNLYKTACDGKKNF